jgi:[ribosomal protein S18]-alanine N-acetyltransferase
MPMRKSLAALRPADAKDLAALIALEQSSFDTDRLSPRQFRTHLSNPNALLWVANVDGNLAGYGLVFTRASTRVARLYSLCVAQSARGAGWGARLLDQLEKRARERGAERMRLEVRANNLAARTLYETRGYGLLRLLPAYYQDGADGVRLEKAL